MIFAIDSSLFVLPSRKSIGGLHLDRWDEYQLRLPNAPISVVFCILDVVSSFAVSLYYSILYNKLPFILFLSRLSQC